MSIRLRTLLIVSFTVLVLLLTTVLTVFISRYAAAKVEHEAGHSLSVIADQMPDKLGNFMWSRAGEVELLGSLDIFRDRTHVDGAQRRS